MKNVLTKKFISAKTELQINDEDEITGEIRIVGNYSNIRGLIRGQNRRVIEGRGSGRIMFNVVV